MKSSTIVKITIPDFAKPQKKYNSSDDFFVEMNRWFCVTICLGFTIGLENSGSLVSSCRMQTASQQLGILTEVLLSGSVWFHISSKTHTGTHNVFWHKLLQYAISGMRVSLQVRNNSIMSSLFEFAVWIPEKNSSSQQIILGFWSRYTIQFWFQCWAPPTHLAITPEGYSKRQ